jgi:hypothetical protein
MSREVRVASVGPRASERRGRSDPLQLGLRLINTPVCSPQSNGMAESNVRTFKRGYVSRMASADNRNDAIDGRQTFNTTAPWSSSTEPTRVGLRGRLQAQRTQQRDPVDLGAVRWGFAPERQQGGHSHCPGLCSCNSDLSTIKLWNSHHEPRASLPCS